MAASSASRVGNIVEEVPVPGHDSVQPVLVETQSTNNAILETIRSCQPDQMGFQTVLTLLSKAVSQPMPVHLHGRNGAGACLSHQVDCQFQPKDFPMSLLGVILVMMVGEKMKMKKKLFKMAPQLLKGKLLSSGLYNMQNWTRSQTPLLLSGTGRTS